MQTELTLQEASLAWAQGKRVEAMGPFRDAWGLVTPIGGGFGIWGPEVFTRTDPIFMFRLAPEPPAKKFRPWTPEEVPVGAIVRTARTGQPFRWMIVAVCGSGITTCGGDSCKTHKHQYLLDSSEHSLDNGKTWLPCGVEVDA
jgi:hypothetical protein